MIKLVDLLNENSTSKYNFGCVMMYLHFPKLKQIQDIIEPEEVYTEEGDKTYGLEDEPHVTLLYGLHEDVTINQVKEVIGQFDLEEKPFFIKLHNVSCFNTPKYDVLKFDAEGDILHKLNEGLKALPFTNEFPDYHPHLTIGYLKQGAGKTYVQGFKSLKFEALPISIIYSQPDGTKTAIKKFTYDR
jgi:2'-5' RNA ligase